MTADLQGLIQEWDGEAVVAHYDRETGAWIFIAIHSSTLGMPVGGCRMKVYPAPADGLRDAMRLARGMTHKLAAVEFSYGGGKSVLAVPHMLDGKARAGLLRRFGRLIESLHGAYATGIDLGTTPGDMAIIAEETEWVFTGHRSRPDGGRSRAPIRRLASSACIRAAARPRLRNRRPAGTLGARAGNRRGRLTAHPDAPRRRRAAVAE